MLIPRHMQKISNNLLHSKKIRAGVLSGSSHSNTSTEQMPQRSLGNQGMQSQFGSCIIQPKLEIGAPNDKYEQEADRVADHVMRMPVTSTTEQSHDKPFNKAPLIQRLCPECDEELKLKPEEVIKEEDEDKLLQAKEMPGQPSAVSHELESSINSLRGGGQPLPNSVRDYMQPRFGHDFSQVQIHTDTKARKAATSIQAKAFTINNNIAFGEGQYSPDTFEGKRLLAHELTHVVQQGGAPSCTQNTSGYRGVGTKLLSTRPDVRRSSQTSVIQRDVLDLIGFGFRQTLTRAVELPDPLARVFDGVVASNIAIASEITIPPSYRQALLDYSASNPLDGVVLLRALARFPKFYSGGWIMDLQPAAGAMTLDHSIFVPEGRSLSLSTYIHEMVHVAQYALLGTTNFLTSYFGLSGATIAFRWARGQPTNPMRSSPHEEQAYNLAARFRGL